MALFCSKISPLFREITWKIVVTFTFWIVFIRFKQQQQQQNKLESHKKACENKDFCGVLLPSKDTKILDQSVS